MAQQVDIIANLLMKVDGAEAGIKKVQSSLSRLKMPNDFNQKFTKSFSNLEGIITRFKNQLNSGFNTKGDVSNITKIAKEMDIELSRISKNFKEVTGQTIDFKVNSSELITAGKKLEELIAKREEIAKKSISLSVKTESGKTGNITELLQGIQKKAGDTKAGQYAKEALNAFQTGNITAYTAAVEKLEKAFSNLRSKAKITADISNGITMGEGVKAIVAHAERASGATRQLDKEIEDVKSDIASIQTSQFEKANKVLLDASASADKLGSELSQTGAAARDFANSTYSMNKQLGELQQSTQYFFSLRNMINLLRQGVDQAIESIKNLDKAMTETAVVTDFSVADMWKDLPKYTKLANELGATTQGAYETMTLYYQQGLDQQATFEIGAETMKMARIAGLDYAQTTDMMTAALRGFNMELSEVSAKRTNDVYSELAARTASDTQEIGEAMERTASIAHSAGMSFEGTAAFLAQMIETTREAPENLGTAMKTIVARFQELKKNPLEISEVDGEAVDFNKIDAALKTIGVDLVATNGQFRNLDEVFLDISKKWGLLTQMQQRYIATVAAGSRQQSRFIAMVGNYDRTMELMEYANESAGASQEQFNKTLDSFEAKMNKLQNAWQQFTMSIANNTFVKGAVDGVTLVLDTVNELINTLSGGNGVVKSFLSLFTAFTGLKVAGRMINGLIGGLGGILDPTTKGGFGAGIRAGALGANASRITNPIVSKLGEILTAVNNIKNRGTKDSNQKQANYEDRKLGLKGLVKDGKLDVGKAREQFKGLSQEDQLRLFQSNRGSMNAIRRSAYTMMNNAFKDNPKMQTLGKAIQTDIFKGMSEGRIKPEVGLKALGNPSSWGAIVGTDTAKAFSASYQEEMRSRRTAAIDKSLKSMVGFVPKDETARRNLMKDKRFGALYKENFESIPLPEAQLTGMDKLANAASGVGGAFTDAGQSISSFGTLLTQLGGPFSIVGSGLQTVGGLVSNFGMAISGVGSAISGLQAAAGAMGVTMSALVGPLIAVTAGIAAIGFVVAKAKKHNDDIKKSAKEVADTYDKATKRIEKNRTTLKNYQGEWERLSQGVDSNGMNVSLEQADYDKYQEMVQKIADINPDIIEGFNAQGKAIITNNKALSETLQLLEQQEKEARKTYTNDKSFRDVIAARNLDKSYRKATQVSGVQYYNTVYGGVYGTGTTKANAPMQGAVQSIANSLDNKDFDININKILSRYNIKLEQLKAGEEKAVKAFVKNQDSISAEIQAAASETGEKASEYYADNLEKGFTSLSKDTAKFNKAIQPTINLLAARLTDSKAYQNIAPEMRSALMSGLEGIAAQDKGYKDIISDAENFATKLGDITAEGSDYSIAMEGAAEAQEHFADSLDVGEYVRETADEIEKLENLKSKYEDSNEAYAQALTEHLNNQIEKIKNFTQEGAASLSEALNWIAPQIQSAEKALENFQEATQNDYSTAAEGMKSIFDEIFKETELENGEKAQLHLQGRGDKTFQTGAISLLGREQVADVYKNKEGVEAEKDLEKRLKRLQPMLQEGADGAEAFWNKLLNLDKKKIPKGVEINKELESLTIEPNNQEAFHQLAVELGMSDDLLASMLSKLQQFGEVSFSNIGDVRKALAVDEGVVGGLGGDQKKLYVRREHLESAMSEAGYSFDQMAREERNLEKKGNIVIIDEPVKLDNRTLSDMGITDMASAIQVLGDTGQYTKEEIFAVAEKFGATQAGFNSAYGDYTKVSQDPSISNIQSIEGTVQDIYSLLASRLIREGELNESNKQSSEIDKQVKSDLVSNFSKGLDAEGNLLSLEKYQSTFDELTKFKSTTQDYLGDLKAGLRAAKTEGDEEKIAEYEEEIDRVKNSLNLLDSQLIEASTAFQALANEAREIQSTKAEVNQKVNEYNKEHKEEGLKKAYNADGFNEKNKLNTEALSTLISKAQAAFNDDKGTQREVIGQYIQNQSKQLVDNNATNEQIKTAINDTAAQLKESGFNSQEIVEAINQGFGTHFQGSDFNYETGQLKPEVDISNLQEQLKNLQAKVTLNVDQINLGTSARGRNNPNSAFRRTGTMARGSRKGYTIPGRPTLMGEDGEEIVWEPKRNEAYIVGSKGPQFGNISKDAVVWNSEQTKRIKKNSGSIGRLGTGSRGINRIGTMAKGNKGGGGGGSASINGRLNLDAAANIKEVVPPEKLAEVPVKAKLQVQGAEKGGIVNKIKSLLGGGKNNGPTVNAAVNVTQFKVGEEKKVNAIANITKLTSNTKETINATAKITNAVKAGTVKGEPVKVKAQAVVSTVSKTDSKAENEIKEVGKKAGGTQTMTVGAETGPATTKINALVNKINHLKPKLHYGVEGPTDINVDIWPHFKGNWNKTYTLNPKKLAKGQHNIIHSSIPQFGSAAKGYGTIGPKGRGGLTLTGEEGFEIAWLPSENRSMVLGANGPQMLNLPANAVVYTHKQSKKIIGQKSIPAGSLVSATKMDFDNNRRVGGGSDSKSTTSGTTAASKSGGDKEAKKNAKDTKKAVKTFTRWVTKAGAVSVWWENIARVMDDAQRKAEKTQTQLKKLLDGFGTTLETYKKTQEQYVNQQQRVLETAAKELEKVNGEIDTLVNGTQGQKNAKASLEAAKAQQNAAKKTKSKKDDKKAAAAVKRARKDQKTENRKAANNETGSAVQVSWEVKQQKKKKKNGKWKTKKKKTKKQIIDLSEFIYEDENGVLQIDQGKINNIAKSKNKNKGKEKAEAIKDAAEKEINDRIAKRNAAEDDAEKAQEALEQMYNDAYQAFNQWDKSITKLYLLGLEVEKLGNLRSAFESVADLEFAKLEAGFSSIIESVPKVRDALKHNVDNLVATAQLNTEKAKAAMEEFEAFLNPANNFENFMKYGAGSPEALKDFQAISEALKAVGEAGFVNGKFDYNAAYDKLNELYASEQNAETYNKLKDGIDKIAEKQNEAINATAEAYQSQTEIYEKIEEYQSLISDFEDSLISGIEEQANKEIDQLSKLNSSLTNAAKDLIDEVKRKLDERRKQEDNAKTENDISRKQQRLAMLRADTAGGHAVEIAQLEKEIADAQQSYGRNLEDQLLDKLQQQNDEAAKQRERQIELLEAQRDLAEVLGTNVAEVNMWLQDPKKYEEQIKAAWMANQDFESKGIYTQAQINEEWNKTWANILAVMSYQDENGEKQVGILEHLLGFVQGSELSTEYLETGSPLENLEKTTSDILKILNEGIKLNTIGIDLTPQTYKNYGYNAAQTMSMLTALGMAPSFEAMSGAYSLEELISAGIYDIDEFTEQGYNLERIVEDLVDKKMLRSEILALIKNSFGKEQRKLAVNILKKMGITTDEQYATGGLATHTGPAWLDGTPTKPELVLNAQDTRNFIALKDVLSHAINSTGSTSQENAVYDIDINVDHINSDYDVDKIAKRVQNIIVEKSSYRNVTQVRSFR